MDEKASAIGCGRNLLHKQTVDTLAGSTVRQCDVQGSLNLAAKLQCFSFFLPAR